MSKFGAVHDFLDPLLQRRIGLREQWNTQRSSESERCDKQQKLKRQDLLHGVGDLELSNLFQTKLPAVPFSQLGIVRANSGHHPSTRKSPCRFVCVEIFESDIQNRIRPPVPVVKMPPLKLVDVEAFVLHRMTQHFSVPPLS